MKCFESHQDTRWLLCILINFQCLLQESSKHNVYSEPRLNPCAIRFKHWRVKEAQWYGIEYSIGLILLFTLMLIPGIYTIKVDIFVSLVFFFSVLFVQSQWINVYRHFAARPAISEQGQFLDMCWCQKRGQQQWTQWASLRQCYLGHMLSGSLFWEETAHIMLN